MSEESGHGKERNVINLFRIAGIRITIDYSWFIIFVLVLWSLSAGYFPREFPGQSMHAYWAAGFVATVFFFGSVLIHELSHSLMAIRNGISIPEITLFIFGGVSKLSQEAKDPVSELEIAIVGPLSSFVLAGLFSILKSISNGLHLPLLMVIFSYLAWINIALGVFNLIPGFPLDGGRVLRALVWWKTGSLTRATKFASDMGKGFAVALMILGGVQIFQGLLLGGLWLLFIGMFLRGVAEGGYHEVIIRQSLEGVHVREVMIREVVAVPPDLPVSGLITAYFLRYGYKGFPVVRNGEVLGVVSLYDVKDIAHELQSTRTVEQVMTVLENDLCIDPEVSLAEALKKMSLEGISRLLVMEGDRMTGMITKTGLLRFLEIKRILER